jgi:hypothetical protein
MLVGCVLSRIIELAGLQSMLSSFSWGWSLRLVLGVLRHSRGSGAQCESELRKEWNTRWRACSLRVGRRVTMDGATGEIPALCEHM